MAKITWNAYLVGFLNGVAFTLGMVATVLTILAHLGVK